MDSDAITSFVARQPIFDEDDRVVAYELLFRGGFQEAIPALQDADLASVRVLMEGVSLQALEPLAAAHPVWINFTRATLLSDFAELFAPARLGVELPGSEPWDLFITETARRLRLEGYTVVLDGLRDLSQLEGREGALSAVKVNWRRASPELRAEAPLRAEPGVEMVALRVETRAEREEAARLGYTRFQGYYFARPVVLQGPLLPTHQSGQRLLRALHQPTFRVDDVAEILRRDVASSYRLLRLVNSAYNQRRTEVSSIRHAIMLLGETQVRRWGTLLAISSLNAGRSPEVVVLGLTRARCCELLVQEAPVPSVSLDSAFLMGLLSVIEAVAPGKPEQILDELPLPPEVRDSLLGAEGPGTTLLDLVRAMEHAEWEEVKELSGRLELPEVDVARAYSTAAGESAYYMEQVLGADS